METSDQADGTLHGLRSCSWRSWCLCRVYVLERNTFSCLFSLATVFLYGFSAGLPSVCIGMPLARCSQERTSWLSHHLSFITA